MADNQREIERLQRQISNANRELRNIERDYNDRIKQETAKMRREMQNFSANLKQDYIQKLQEMEQSFSNAYLNEMERMRRRYNELTEQVAIYENELIRKKELFTSWKKEIDVQAKSYADSLHTTFGTMKAEVNHQISKFNEMKTQLQENMRLQEYASSQLKDAEAAIHAVQIELGSIPNNTVEEYNKAADYFNKGMYEPAYGIASSIVLECYDYLEEGISDREKKYALIDLLEAQIVEMKAQIESMKAFQFEYKDEMYETDLSMYEPVFKAVISRLEKLDAAISDIDGKTLRDFADIQEQLADIELDIQNCTKLAVQKLLSAYTENDTASDITAAMEDQGYDMDGYAYESGEEGNPIHVNFVNRVSGGRVTVVMSPKTDGIHLDVHDYGVDGAADAQRQDEIRHLIEKTLNIQIHCSGRGTVSSHTQAADLTAVETTNLR